MGEEVAEHSDGDGISLTRKRAVNGKLTPPQLTEHTRAAIGHATALAVSRRERVSEHALRRNRPNRHTFDDLLHPPTAPVAF